MIVGPTIQVSWGELIDKLTILEIKRRRMQSPDALASIERELAALSPALVALNSPPPELASLQTALALVNERLWTVEDAIRQKEADRSFDDHFVALARAVYHENDERARIKRAINELLQSPLVEQKQYVNY